METGDNGSAVKENPKNMSIVDMKTAIEKWDKYHQVEILRILNRCEKTKINQNKNGIFVNMSCLRPDTLAAIAQYIDYVQQQTLQLALIEKEKEKYKKTFFSDISEANT